MERRGVAQISIFVALLRFCYQYLRHCIDTAWRAETRLERRATSTLKYSSYKIESTSSLPMLFLSSSFSSFFLHSPLCSTAKPPPSCGAACRSSYSHPWAQFKIPFLSLSSFRGGTWSQLQSTRGQESTQVDACLLCQQSVHLPPLALQAKRGLHATMLESRSRSNRDYQSPTRQRTVCAVQGEYRVSLLGAGRFRDGECHHSLHPLLLFKESDYSLDSSTCDY